MADRFPTRVEITGEGPVLIHGPVELFTPDGRRVRCERAVTALCTCRRSRRYPMCDTSHRRCARSRRREHDDHQDQTETDQRR
ncbi:CDGSH iron-sulfur domain-containing protein [Saccharopolyspora phatthalungensis]|uniref:CDGSH-type Zn-finger protein n=1 Tax=Saccharopolyspora phatthalungensis TaxID=664693 RepID=A0A840QAF2_9PSEU|nr:CDGSH iron-sulfur domain-containing protein [Saccharopolyspora phatthalungensis]MBB5156927.1 CDGSH-type Zn-finger protein [Saccharopolyspora phatthalungensis]